MNDLFDTGSTLVELEKGGLILFPTDTIWGIGCDATNDAAVHRVRKLKERPSDQGLIILVDSIEMLQHYAGDVHPRLQTLLSIHNRPLTVIYPAVQGVSDGVRAADGSVAIRIADDAYCKALIGKFSRPLVATSANFRGQEPPAMFSAITSDVLSAVDHVVKYRQRDTTPREPSMVARWTEQNEIEPIRTS